MQINIITSAEIISHEIDPNRDTVDSLLKEHAHDHCYFEHNGSVLTELEDLEDSSNIYVRIDYMEKYKDVALKDVPEEDRVNEVCIAAIKRNGLALKYVINQTNEICLAAVKQNGHALNYVINKTDEICLAAVKQNGYALNYVENQTDEICLVAVKQNGFALIYVNDETEEICLAADGQKFYLSAAERDEINEH
jgi:cytochrome oxidase Cu insertion factor (SCO1/SenC/PrrC family)